MKLQAALDTLTLDECVTLLEQTKGSIDVVEVGTPFVIEQGMVPVCTFKEKFPDIEVLADAKIMDAGKYIKGVVESAKEHGRQVMVDMIEVKNLAQRTKEVDQMGVDYICVHTAFDVQATGKDPLDDLKVVNSVIKNAQSAVAGGVKLATIDAIVEEGAGIIVVGGAICNAEDPSAMAKEMKKHLK